MEYSTISLLDPPSASPIAAAIGWIDGAALGTLASVVAVIAVAAIGLMLLSGRIDFRRGGVVALGCFLIFGARGIVVQFRGDGNSVTAEAPGIDPVPNLRVPTKAPTVYDPYAGAAVPIS